MSSVDFRRDPFSRSSSTSSANASLDESADEELMELVLTIANPSREIKSSVEDEIRGEVGGVVGLETLLSESRLLLNSFEATVGRIAGFLLALLEEAKGKDADFSLLERAIFI
jgi:hypothetical protein